MNAASAPGAQRPRWRSRIENWVNRAADELMADAELLARNFDELWRSLTHRSKHKHA
jgi:hypothetical protein